MAETSFVGYRWKLYRNTGTYDTPVWSFITRMRDLSLEMSREDVDDSTRDSQFMKTIGGMVQVGVTGQMKYNMGNTDHAYFKDAILADPSTVFEIAIMNGDISVAANEGLRFYCHVQQNNFSMALTDNSLIDMEFRPAYFDDAGTERDPEWWTVPGP